MAIATFFEAARLTDFCACRIGNSCCALCPWRIAARLRIFGAGHINHSFQESAHDPHGLAVAGRV
jgi:hypothetical protein